MGRDVSTEVPEGGNITSTFKTLAAVMLERADLRIQRSLAFLHRTSYDARVGDVILLVTDKLAYWIWQMLENQNLRWTELLKLADEKEFREFVRAERDAVL